MSLTGKEGENFALLTYQHGFDVPTALIWRWLNFVLENTW